MLVPDLIWDTILESRMVPEALQGPYDRHHRWDDLRSYLVRVKSGADPHDRVQLPEITVHIMKIKDLQAVIWMLLSKQELDIFRELDEILSKRGYQPLTFWFIRGQSLAFPLHATFDQLRDYHDHQELTIKPKITFVTGTLHKVLSGIIDKLQL